MRTENFVRRQARQFCLGLIVNFDDAMLRHADDAEWKGIEFVFIELFELAESNIDKARQAGRNHSHAHLQIIATSPTVDDGPIPDFAGSSRYRALEFTDR